jgi:hypothetical protein
LKIDLPVNTLNREELIPGRKEATTSCLNYKGEINEKKNIRINFPEYDGKCFQCSNLNIAL